MTLFEQPPHRAPRPVDDGPFAALARARRRRRSWWVVGIAGAVLLLLTGLAAGTGGLGIPQVMAALGPKTLPAAIAAVADRAYLTEEGRELLTQVGARDARGDDLNDACGGDDRSGDHATYGCYSRAGIVVFVPADARVADSAVTTLAHELLHAAFDRLGAGEIWRVKDQLHAAMERVAPDDRVRQQIEWSIDGHEESRDTELFAYLGSQVWPDGGFSPELEAVYARYFTDRAALVAVGHRVEGDVERLLADYESAVDDLTRGTADAANERARLEGDRQMYEVDRQSYQQDADRYNALDPVERGRWTVSRSDSTGSVYTGTWQDALAAWLADLDTRRADLDARIAAVDAADAAAAARLAEIEAQYADVMTVTRALDPTAPGA